MNRYEILIDINEEHQNIISDILPIILKIGRENNLPNYSKLILSFVTKMNFIKNGIFDLYESQNSYSIKIQFRVLIEHYIKFNYLFMQYTKEQSDSIAIDYNKYSSYSESVLLGKSYKRINDILDIESDFDSYKLLQDFVPELRDTSWKTLKQKISEYDIFHMIRYINDRINKDKTFEGNEFLLTLFPIYSELSSFVHCGTSADNMMFKLVDEKARDMDLINDVSFALRMTVATSTFSLISFAKFDNTLMDKVLKLEKLQKKI